MRNPSHIEHVMKNIKRTSKATRVSSKSKSKAKESNDVPQDPNICVERWGITFPPKSFDNFMFSFIINAKDVRADGHCGYLGLRQSAWRDV